MLKVRTLCKPCKVFLRGHMTVPAVTLHGRVDTCPDLRIHIIVDVINECVEVAAKHFPESVVGHAFMKQGVDDITDSPVVRQYNSDLVCALVEESL